MYSTKYVHTYVLHLVYLLMYTGSLCLPVQPQLNCSDLVHTYVHTVQHVRTCVLENVHLDIQQCTVYCTYV